MIGFRAMAAGVALAAGCVTFVNAETLTIATVNNDDMIIMQKLSSKWEQQTGNKINWVILEENVLRQKVTTDIATKGGQFDVSRSAPTKRRSGAKRAGLPAWMISRTTTMTICSRP